MRHEDYKELLALEAAGALAAGELAALEAHLPSCAECREELRELRDAAAALTLTLAPVAPPKQLRLHVLESVRTQAAKTYSAADGEAFKSADDARPEHARSAHAPAEGFGLWQLFAARPSFALGAALGLGLIAALSVLSYVLWTRTRELRAEIARVSAEANASREEAARGREQLTREREALERDLNELLASPGSRLARLSGKEAAPGASALLAYDRSTGRALLLASGLPPAPEGKAYQLWFIAGGKPLPGGLFKTDGRGGARLSDRLPSDAATPSAFAVTLEREAGETAPKGEMYLLSAAS